MSKEELKDGSTGWKMAIIILAPSLILLATVLFVPSDLSPHPYLDLYVSKVRGLVPSIDLLASVSKFPGVTQLVLAVAWTLCPIQVVLILKWRIVRIDWSRAREFRFGFGFLTIFMLLPFVVIMIFFLDPIGIDPNGKLIHELVIRYITSSRVGLAIVGEFFIAGVALAIGAIWLWIVNFRRIYL